MSTPELRLATADDFVAIAAITNHYIRTSAIHFAYDEVAPDTLRATWRQQAVYPWLVAAAGDELVGYAKAGVFRERAAYRWTTETGVYLHPDRRGLGHGTPLYARLLAVLRAQGFHAAIGGIALPNEPSVRLHRRLGFVQVGVIPRAGRKFDRWHDVAFWHLPLQPEHQAPVRLSTPADAFAASAPS